MLIHRMILVLTLAWVATAADKPRWQTVELQDVDFDFRLVQDVGEIERLLGDRLDGDFTLVEVRLRALYGTTVELDRDSFTLRSFSGNDTSAAQSPDRIAGGGSLLVRPGTVGAPGHYRANPRESIPVGPNPEGGPPRVDPSAQGRHQAGAEWRATVHAVLRLRCERGLAALATNAVEIGFRHSQKVRMPAEPRYSPGIESSSGNAPSVNA